MSTKKILVVGDSYSMDHMYPLTPHAWPTFLAKENDWTLINLSRGGQGNDFILNQAVDGIEKYKPDIAIALWSDPFRINLFDIDTQILDSQEQLLGVYSKELRYKTGKNLDQVETYIDQASEFCNLVVEIIRTRNKKIYSLSDAYATCVKNSLRSFYLFEQMCKMNNIAFVHGQALPSIGGDSALKALSPAFPEDIPDMDICINKIKDLTYYKLLDESRYYMGHDWCAWNFIAANNLTVSEYDHHPNQEGHQELAKIMNDFLRSNIRPQTNTDAGRPVYVYD